MVPNELNQNVYALVSGDQRKNISNGSMEKNLGGGVLFKIGTTASQLDVSSEILNK